MKHVLITSMLAIGLGCGTAMAQTQQPADNQSGADTNCTSGTANCKPGSKMNGQAQDKSTTKTDKQAQGKAKAQTDQQAQGKAGTSTDQQAQGKAKVQTDQQAQGKTGTSTDQQAQDKTKVQTDQQAQGKASTQDKTSTASINNVTVEQKTQITQVIKETKVQPVANVDFDVSVGVEIPRHKIRLHRLPARIVKIVPAYESYEYFVLADGRIVIVDPDSLKIVLILT
ncbi:DUF1236 domain-containing protein [Mesorhizobium sp. B2-4-12]|uniref:DUF1236 domain-containing protein n=1 Tax=unclassified Mesorhizobium TaxID=325217 RepID=UPI00112DA772|nr:MULTISPECIES: DUF1236 domain-containing protein [unclassified Mesorhizobium]TPK93032.1 DUF1236 domain-containing protein [Mesorhizobium sp. B2-4-12]TPL06150.1 DUF1236 domain-containing protein [Mesorhizobium sp. B2-4-14]